MPASVNREDLTGQIGRRGGELPGERSYFLGLAIASHRDILFQCSALLCVKAAVHARVDDTTGDGINGDIAGRSSFARAFVKLLTPPLEAEYATSQEAPTLPQTEEILMIQPDFRRTM